MGETTSERFEPVEGDEILLQATTFDGYDKAVLSAGENPSMTIGGAELCPPEGEHVGSMELRTGQTLHAMAAFEDDEYDRLRGWLEANAPSKATVHESHEAWQQAQLGAMNR